MQMSIFAFIDQIMRYQGSRPHQAAAISSMGGWTLFHSGVRYRPGHICSRRAICTYCLRATTRPCTHGWPRKGSESLSPLFSAISRSEGEHDFLISQKQQTASRHQTEKSFHFKVSFIKQEITLNISEVIVTVRHMEMTERTGCAHWYIKYTFTTYTSQSSFHHNCNLKCFENNK